MTRTANLAILAPVPEHHLETGREKVEEENLPFLAFGSGDARGEGGLRMLEMFNDIGRDPSDRPVPLLIYPSKRSLHDYQPPPYQVCWAGWYIGYEEANDVG